MREAIGGTWLVQIVVVFVLLFTGFMCLTINHTKAFNVKNEIVNAIERYDGIDLSNPDTDPAMKTIVAYLKKASYRTIGSCPDASYTGYNRDGKLDNKNATFCIKKQNVRGVDYHPEEFPDMSYYRVVVFYQLDLPILSSAFNFRLTGDTKVIDVGDVQ